MSVIFGACMAWRKLSFLHILQLHFSENNEKVQNTKRKIKQSVFFSVASRKIQPGVCRPKTQTQLALCVYLNRNATHPSAVMAEKDHGGLVMDLPSSEIIWNQ